MMFPRVHRDIKQGSSQHTTANGQSVDVTKFHEKTQQEIKGNLIQ